MALAGDNNMGLISWPAPSDTFSYAALSDNLDKLDRHDHSSGKGVAIGEAGLANNAVSTNKLQDVSVTTNKLVNEAVTLGKLNATVRADWEHTYSAWKRLNTGAYTFNAAGAAGTFLLPGAGASTSGEGAGIGVSGSTRTATNTVYLDPADFAAGPRTVGFRLRCFAWTGNTAPAATFTARLLSAATPTGTSSVSATNSAVAGTDVVFTTPAANTMTTSVGTAVALAAGYYVLACNLSAAMAASSSTLIVAHLEYRQT